MRCPTCGAETNSGQNFCRACGAAFDDSLMVTGRRPSLPSSGLAIGLLLLMAGTAIGVVGRMIVESQMIAGIGVLIALAGMTLTALSSLGAFRSIVPRRQSPDRAAPVSLEAAQPTNRLPEPSEWPIGVSVTEDTTELLSSKTKR